MTHSSTLSFLESFDEIWSCYFAEILGKKLTAKIMVVVKKNQLSSQSGDFSRPLLFKSYQKTNVPLSVFSCNHFAPQLES